MIFSEKRANKKYAEYPPDEFKQYKILKLAMESGQVERMRDVLEFIPITCLSKHMEINYNTLCKRLLDPNRLTVPNVKRFAFLINTDSSEVFRRISDEIDSESSRQALYHEQELKGA